jgi:hypothetical protein
MRDAQQQMGSSTGRALDDSLNGIHVLANELVTRPESRHSRILGPQARALGVVALPVITSFVCGSGRTAMRVGDTAWLPQPRRIDECTSPP